ncbi:putative zinc protease [Cyphellophora attinorum]|uniref:Putative zinc protease n=1 Tax=Cyphellophora attinorum TaxID=1664694 RepID=A0A0N1GXY0_9EURO|nr:putative zinc protease [Phialophora attinorum]KPI35377.1 putative zinc protease [Phialophora attinorum]
MQPVRRIADRLEKPETDDREYRVVELSNKLEALLVHDNKTDKASAALNVNVGNFSDEEDMPGMAHAVEHLLFMGTKKYPVENEYSSYLSSNSGYSNAYTAATQTNYFFECAAVNEGQQTTNGTHTNGVTNGAAKGPLYGALDRFAQFFVEPLFLENTLDREMRAVDSENKKNLQNDMWRLSQLAKSLSNPKHPYHHFSTGNLKTLKEDPEKRGVKIRDEFIRFYEKHYSANRMKLVVLGRESLDELEEWVVELFSGVKNKDLPENRWDDQRPLSKEELSTEIFAKPVMESRSLEISFPWQDEEDMYETQPARYISHLIGHEGPGSILAYLKDKGLANSLSAGYHTVCPGSAFFEIEISLTPEGLEKYRDVVKIVFQYVSMMKQDPPVDWMHEEMKNMAEVDFRFRQKSPASRFTSGTSSIMQKPLPREWLLSGISKFRKFDPKAIVNAMQFLKDDNFRLMIVAQDFPGDWNEKERWYGTDYKVQKFPVEVHDEFRKALAASSSERPADLHLPHKNEFIPTRLDVEKVDVNEPVKTPKLLRNDDKMRLWWKKDDSFWVPKANVNILLRNGLTYATPANYVKTSLFTSLVKDALTSYSYDAEISGLVYNVVADPYGMNVLVHGYNDKLSVLLEKILTTIRDLELRQDRFDIIKERKTRQFKNWDFQQPYHIVGEYTRWLLNEKAWMTHQYAEELPHITLEDLKSFAPQLINQAHIEILAHGNLYKDEAKKLGSLVDSTLRPRILPSSQWALRRNMILPEGSNAVYRTKLADPENVNHGIEYYIQVGGVMDQELRAKLQLFSQITEEPGFDQLRTKEQLGYVVWSGTRAAATMMGYRILIQSERNPEYLETRCDAFLLKMRGYIEEMSQEDFEGHKRSLITKRLEKLKNLDSETGRLWTYINSEHFSFFQVDQDVEAIRKLTKKDVIKFYTQYLAPESPRRAKLAIHLEAKKDASEEPAPDTADQRNQLVEVAGQLLQSANVTPDEVRLSAAFEKLDITDKAAVTASIISAAREASAGELQIEQLSTQLEEAIPQVFMALKITPAAAQEGEEQVNGQNTPQVDVAAPVVINDVVRWKAGLEISRGPVPVVDLKDFEEVEAKL